MSIFSKASCYILQNALREYFGKSETSTGECTLSISHNKVELTDENCVIIARGPARVARVLVRKRKARKG